MQVVTTNYYIFLFLELEFKLCDYSNYNLSFAFVGKKQHKVCIKTQRNTNNVITLSRYNIVILMQE